MRELADSERWQKALGGVLRTHLCQEGRGGGATSTGSARAPLTPSSPESRQVVGAAPEQQGRRTAAPGRACARRTGVSGSGGCLVGAGGGLTAAEAAAVLRLVGEFATPVPLAETSMLAGWLLAEAGLPQAPGLATTGRATVTPREQDRWRVSGLVRRIPAAADAELLVLVADVDGGGAAVLDLPLTGWVRVEGHAVARESRDDVVLDEPVDAVAPIADGTADELRRPGGLSRAVLISGALDRVLSLSLRYAKEREQFGRPLAAFQAVQQQLALLAVEVAAARAAVDAAVRTCEDGFGTRGAAVAVAAQGTHLSV